MCDKDQKLVKRYADVQMEYLMHIKMRTLFCDSIIDKYLKQVECIPTIFEIGLISVGESLGLIRTYVNECMDKVKKEYDDGFERE